MSMTASTPKNIEMSQDIPTGVVSQEAPPLATETVPTPNRGFGGVFGRRQLVIYAVTLGASLAVNAAGWEILRPGTFTRKVPYAVASELSNLLLGDPEFTNAREENLASTPELTEEERAYIYKNAGTDQVGFEEFSCLVNQLANCSICLNGESKPREVYIEDFVKMCKTIRTLSEMQGVDYATCLGMFYVSGSNESTGGRAKEVALEKKRTTARRMYYHEPELTLSSLKAMSDIAGLPIYDISRILGPITIGIHDMEMVEIAQAVASDNRFKKAYPVEAGHLEQIVIARNSLDEEKGKYMDEAEKLLETEAFKELITDPNFIKQLILNANGGLNEHQLFKTTFVWAEACRLTRVEDTGSQMKLTGEQQERQTIEDAIYFYKENPIRLLSDQVENPILKNWLVKEGNKTVSTTGLVEIMDTISKKTKVVLEVEGEAATVIVKKEMDPGFQAVTGVDFAVRKIKQAEQAFYYIKETLGIKDQDKPGMYELLLLANAFREISSTFALSNRDCPLYMDTPYANPTAIATYFCTAIRKIGDVPASLNVQTMLKAIENISKNARFYANIPIPVSIIEPEAQDILNSYTPHTTAWNAGRDVVTQLLEARQKDQGKK